MNKSFYTSLAAELNNRTVEDGFEHEGMWITDRTKSPCGRFELTPEESEKLYGKENG